MAGFACISVILGVRRPLDPGHPTLHQDVTWITLNPTACPDSGVSGRYPFVIVPDTKAAQYDPVAAGGVLPQPGMWWWATYYARPATDEEATAQARERLSVMLDGLAALGVPVEGDLGGSDPLEAIEKVCADRQFDEIIVTTLPQYVSRWLRSDLPHQAERRFGLPVTTIITRN
jgi:nucleotide-binding universal stress UspA family protein